MADIKSLEIKMLIHKLDSFKKEMEYKNEKLEFINDLFLREILGDDLSLSEKEIVEVDENTPVEDNKINEEMNSGNTEQSKEETVKEILETIKNKIELPSDIKKIYRKITTLTHLDKLSDNDPLKDEKMKIYLDATTAANKNDIATILFLGYKLDLEINIIENYNEYINREINKLSLQLNSIEYTNSWIWYHTSNESLKKIMIERIKIQMLKHKKENK
jgi:hypothetical protein